MSEAKFCEPWEADSIHIVAVVKGARPTGEVIATVEPFAGTIKNSYDRCGYAERIVECVNALEGYEPSKVRELLDDLCDNEGYARYLNIRTRARSCRQGER